MFILQGPTYPNIQRQVRSPSWSIRISMYQSIPHWKGWVKFIIEGLLCGWICAYQLLLCFKDQFSCVATEISLGGVLPSCTLSLVSESHSDQQCTSTWWWLWVWGWQQLSGQFTDLHPESGQEGQRPWKPACCQERWGLQITVQIGQGKLCTSNISSSLVLERLSKFSCD